MIFSFSCRLFLYYTTIASRRKCPGPYKSTSEVDFLTSILLEDNATISRDDIYQQKIISVLCIILCIIMINLNAEGGDVKK